MSSVNFCRRARFTFLNLSNSVSTGCGAKRTETCLDFLARGDDDEGATGAVGEAGEVVEVGVGTGSMWGDWVNVGISGDARLCGWCGKGNCSRDDR